MKPISTLPRLWSLLLAGLVVLAGAPLASAQVTALSEDFESATVAYTTAPTASEYNDGSGDFFTRTDGSNISSTYVVTGAGGSSYFAAQDLDGDGESPVQSLVFSGIDVSGLTNLSFNARFAEDDASDGNEDWDVADHVRVYASLDGGAETLVFAIEDQGATNTAPRVDTDFDGVGDGTEITPDFAAFQAAIAGSGSTLTLRIEIALEAGDEDIAIDDVTVTGTGGAAGGALIVTTADDEMNADGDCSLREAVQAANTNTVVDQCDGTSGDQITFASAYTITLSLGELLVTEGVDVDASGTPGVVVDGNGASRIFDVNAPDETVVFSALTLQNGNSGMGGSSAPNAGGAVDLKSGSAAIFNGVNVLTSTAGVNGGGIHGAGNTSIVINGGGESGFPSLIQGNVAEGAAAGMGGGGVWGAGTVAISGDVTIDGNMATGAAGSGGGVFNFGGVLTITGATISNNMANRAGGGVEDFGDADDDTDVTLTNVTLSGNSIATANPGNGGGLHSGGGEIVVVGGSVTGNTATEGGGLWASGSLDVSGGTVIDGNSGTGPAADNGGGGLYNEGGTMTVSGATITNNTASGTAGSGGGILNAGGTLSVTGGLIQFNTANRAGGGIEDAGGTVTLTQVTVNGNFIATAAPGNGGGLHSGGGNVTVIGGEITRNTAVEGGGLWSNKTLTLLPDADGVSTRLIFNEATGDDATQGGGGIYAESGAAVTGTDAVIGWNRATGTSGSGGGVLVADSASVSLTGGEVTWNNANRAGAGIEVADATATAAPTGISLDGVEVTWNSIPQDTAMPGNGGGLHVGGVGSAVVSQSTVANNGASEGGGLWISAGGSLNLSLSTVSNNNSFGAGGGVYDDGPGGSIALFSVTVADNTALGADGGGGLLSQSADGASFTFENTLVGNNVALQGGADCAGTFTSGDFNLIEDMAGCTLNGATANNVTGQDPVLGALTDNGGPTATRALLAGSPAIDAGSTDFAIDQRGFARADGTDDIGAFEFGGQANVAACTMQAPLNFDFDGDGDGSSVMADDFNSVGDDPTYGEFAGVRNIAGTGANSVALSACSFVVFDPFTEKVTYSAVTTGTVAPASVFVLATTGGDQALPPMTLPDSPGAFALVEGTATVGDDVSAVFGRVVAAVVYDRDRSVFGSIGGGATQAQRDAFARTLADIFGAPTAAEGDQEIDLTAAVWPNPTRGATTIGFGLRERSDVRVSVLDALGREVAVVADQSFGAGRHQAVLRAGALPSGVYIVRVVTEGRVESARLTVAR